MQASCYSCPLHRQETRVKLCWNPMMPMCSRNWRLTLKKYVCIGSLQVSSGEFSRFSIQNTEHCILFFLNKTQIRNQSLVHENVSCKLNPPVKDGVIFCAIHGFALNEWVWRMLSRKSSGDAMTDDHVHWSYFFSHFTRTWKSERTQVFIKMCLSIITGTLKSNKKILLQTAHI